MLGLGGAAAVTAGLGSKALGGTIEEDKGTLWKTETFDDGVVYMKDDALRAMLEKKPSAEAKEAVKTLMADNSVVLDQYFYESPMVGRVVTLTVGGDYDRNYCNFIDVFGRRPKMGETVRFRGQSAEYTVIAVEDALGERPARRSRILLDRPLQLAVEDRTPILKPYEHRRSLMRSSGRLNPGEIMIINGGERITLGGVAAITYTSHYAPVYDHEGDECPLDITLDVKIDYATPTMDVAKLMHDRLKPPYFTLVAVIGQDEYVFEKCYWTAISQNMASATLSIDMRSLKAEVRRA